ERKNTAAASASGAASPTARITARQDRALNASASAASAVAPMKAAQPTSPSAGATSSQRETIAHASRETATARKPHFTTAARLGRRRRSAGTDIGSAGPPKGSTGPVIGRTPTVLGFPRPEELALASRAPRARASRRA